MAEKIDGEKYRDIVLNQENPQTLSLREIAEELANYTGLKELLGVEREVKKHPLSPDIHVILSTIEQRIQKLYAELERRERFYYPK